MLKNWRLKNKLTMAQAAALLGVGSASQIFYIERGDTFPTPETIEQIEAATGGEVTIFHHQRAWRRRHPLTVSEFRAAGRTAAKAHRVPAPQRRK